MIAVCEVSRGSLEATCVRFNPYTNAFIETVCSSPSIRVEELRFDIRCAREDYEAAENEEYNADTGEYVFSSQPYEDYEENTRWIQVELYRLKREIASTKCSS